MATYSSTRSGRGRSLRRGESRRPGQWKLAYADFLTALMALFLFMWLSTEQSVDGRQGIAEFFKGEPGSTVGRELEKTPFDLLAEQLAASPILSANSAQVTTSANATEFRIELTDSVGSPIFARGKSEISELGFSLISATAKLIGDQSFFVKVEGHTDAFPSDFEDYSNWDLSTARANAARTALEHEGVGLNQIQAVIGLADKKPLLPNQPHAAANRRISIVLELNG